jgi:hypothetical protein
MKQTPKPESSSIFNKIPKELFAASITGALGLLGVIITVIANHSGSSPAVKSMETGVSPTAMVTEHVMEATSTPAEASLPTFTISPSIDIQDKIRIKEEWGGCTNKFYLPDSIDPNTNATKATGQFKKLIGFNSNNPFYTPDSARWSDFDFLDNSQYFLVSLTGLGDNEEWITLENSVVDSVEVSSVPKHLNMVSVSGCGGGMEVRNFDSIPLKSDFDSYTVKSVFPDNKISGFSLAPGETEQFQFPFECKQPGIYTVRFKLPCKYLGSTCSVEFTPPTTAVCPDTFTNWDATAPIMYNDPNGVLNFAGDYYWNGAGYSLSD